ncbi:hypothetical protein AMTR_s00235p00024180 [Amborella trichopoda]|uniref:Uncharacterized protein n=1 Tax=Amborella trichopoda TaxID=13333 RepID=W1NVL2_AMBTC|nr:hypothetical protein AMTR_s00235p00024180 [Amborella trichopoda]
MRHAFIESEMLNAKCEIERLVEVITRKKHELQLPDRTKAPSRTLGPDSQRLLLQGKAAKKHSHRDTSP